MAYYHHPYHLGSLYELTMTHLNSQTGITAQEWFKLEGEPLAVIDPEPLGYGKKRPRPVTPEPAAKHIMIGAADRLTQLHGYRIPHGDRNTLVQYTNWSMNSLIRGIQRWWRRLRLKFWRRHMLEQEAWLSNRHEPPRSQPRVFR